MKSIGIISHKAILPLARALTKRGHEVAVLDKFRDDPFDLVIVHGNPEPAAQWKGSSLVFWPDGFCNSLLSQESIDSYSQVIWLSECQRRQWIAINPALSRFSAVVGMGIDPQEFKPAQIRTNPHACIYASSDARGLEWLLMHWAFLKMSYPQATLDLYYGKEHWKNLSAKQEESLRKKIHVLKPMAIQEHPNATDEEIDRAFEKSSLWLQPCSLEPFSLFSLKAQAAGAIPVVLLPQESALRETVLAGIGRENAHEYGDMLSRTFSQVQSISPDARRQIQRAIAGKYHWEILTSRLEELCIHP